MAFEATRVQRGDAIDHTPSGADVAAGEVIVLTGGVAGAMIGVAEHLIPDGKLGALAVTGVFEVYKAAADTLTFAPGDDVYWNAAGNKATQTATDQYNGIAVADAAAADTSVRVLLVQAEAT